MNLQHDGGNPQPVLPNAGFKRPESVLVLVYSTDGWVLLLERRQPKGFWQSVTGSLHWGETARAAAVRELYEETGLRAGGALQALHQCRRFPIQGAWRARYAPTARFNTEHWFALALPSRRVVKLNRREHSRYRWVRAARAMQLASSSTNVEAIKTVVC